MTLVDDSLHRLDELRAARLSGSPAEDAALMSQAHARWQPEQMPPMAAHEGEGVVADVVVGKPQKLMLLATVNCLVDSML